MQTGNFHKLVLFTLLLTLSLLMDVAVGGEVFSRKTFFDDLRKGKKLSLTYDFYMMGKKIGILSSVFEKNPDKNKEKKEYRVKSTLKLDLNTINVSKTIIGNESICLSPAGKIVNYTFDLADDGNKTHIEARIDDSSVREIMMTGSAQYKKEIKIPGKPLYILDNNMIDHWFLLFMSLNIKAEKNYEIEAFVPQSMMKTTINIRYLGRENLKIKSTEYEGFIYYVDEVNEIMSITKNGLLVRIEDPVQKLVITLSSLEISENTEGIK